MKSKYKCDDCGLIFWADIKGKIECPNCKEQESQDAQELNEHFGVIE